MQEAGPKRVVLEMTVLQRWGTDQGLLRVSDGGGPKGDRVIKGQHEGSLWLWNCPVMTGVVNT